MGTSVNNVMYALSCGDILGDTEKKVTKLILAFNDRFEHLETLAGRITKLICEIDSLNDSDPVSEVTANFRKKNWLLTPVMSVINWPRLRSLKSEFSKLIGEYSSGFYALENEHTALTIAIRNANLTVSSVKEGASSRAGHGHLIDGIGHNLSESHMGHYKVPPFPGTLPSPSSFKISGCSSL